jgi:hypothetical protein
MMVTEKLCYSNLRRLIVTHEGQMGRRARRDSIPVKLRDKRAIPIHSTKSKAARDFSATAHKKKEARLTRHRRTNHDSGWCFQRLRTCSELRPTGH